MEFTSTKKSEKRQDGLLPRVSEMKLARMVVPAGIEPETIKSDGPEEEFDVIDISRLKSIDE